MILMRIKSLLYCMACQSLPICTPKAHPLVVVSKSSYLLDYRHRYNFIDRPLALLKHFIIHAQRC